ncbi:MAG: alpha/beta hydrolase [Cyclobacteriaceae bacterium]
MKKILIGLLLIFILILSIGFFYGPTYTFQMITDYEPFTFDRVLGDSTWMAEYQIGDRDHPEDYGYENTEEVTFSSLKDNLQLSAWYVPASQPTDSTIFMIHGRTSNRLKTMKYLELFKDKGLDTLYNIFIADMRNSGKSEGASTYMGYKFAEDIAGGLEFLSNEKNQNHFILYGFSMGAMATFTLFGRDDLDASRYDVQKIIVDSPLTNVDAVLRENADKLGLPDFIFDKAYGNMNEATDNYTGKLKMAPQINGLDIPILVLQSNHDRTTPARHTKEQLANLSDSKISTWFMDSADHVKLYTHPDYRETYANKVDTFIRKTF